jgi:uncharacterized protein YndB with AHSA1/START domain
MPDILHRLTIKAPPERVYRALTTPEGVRAWWTGDCDLATEVGGPALFRFSNGRVTEARVETLEPSVRVEWTVVSAFMPGWIGTRISFELIPDEGGTTIAFFHRGFAEDDKWFALTTTGWGYYLVSLQQLLERGKGAPAPNVDFARMIA